jgi:hypothetical protein
MMGKQVAISKVSKAKRWVHPYNELNNFFFIQHKMKMGFLFVSLCYGKTSNWWTQWGFYLCVVVYGRVFNLMHPNGCFCLCIYVITIPSIWWTQWGSIYVLWFNIQFDRSMEFIFVCYDLCKTFNLMDPWVSWKPLSHDEWSSFI